MYILYTYGLQEPTLSEIIFDYFRINKHFEND